jgi:hypothetical protein
MGGVSGTVVLEVLVTLFVVTVDDARTEVRQQDCTNDDGYYSNQ